MALEIVRGDLSWSGEHWICMLRQPGSEDTAVVSHYRLRVSPAGPGNVAIIHVPGADGAHVIATDNDDAAVFAKERFFAGRVDYFQGDLPVRQATFERIGEGQPGSGWSYRFAGTEVSARWFVREPPVVAHGHLRPGNWCFTVLYAEEAELHLNAACRARHSPATSGAPPSAATAAPASTPWPRPSSIRSKKPCAVAGSPPPAPRRRYWCFTVLYLSRTPEEAELHLNGRRVPGRGADFTRDIWRTSIGGDRSSCVYALARQADAVRRLLRGVLHQMARQNPVQALPHFPVRIAQAIQRLAAQLLLSRDRQIAGLEQQRLRADPIHVERRQQFLRAHRPIQ